MNCSSIKEVEWYVLAKQGDKVLLMSKYILDAQPFDEGNRSISWEQGTLYSWLEKDFYNKAFSSDKKGYADICLLGEEELQGYLNSLPEEMDEILKTSPTKYAISQGLKESWYYDVYSWWIGDKVSKYVGGDYLASVVHADSTYISNYVTDSYEVEGVRPFAWIELD